jgi:putative phosphoesterase
VLSDVHGNAVALAAVLDQLEEALPDLVVFGGDLTWGPLPQETLALVDAMATPTMFVRGNADRALSEPPTTPRSTWMLGIHTDEQRARLAAFPKTVSLSVERLGPVRICHGSPRSDEELITFETPEPRMRALMEGVDERVLVSAHTHLQFDREVAGIRSVNAGSVGMPYVDGRRARTGHCSAPTSSCVGRTTTSTRLHAGTARPTIRSRRRWSSCSSRLRAPPRSSSMPRAWSSRDNSLQV